MKTNCWMGSSGAALLLAGLLPLWGQTGGDQFLDGIGETALAARYLFNGNERDSSRNAQHASLQGAGAAYVDDPRFGRVLSLPGGQGAFVKIPGRTLEGLDTVSVSGWLLAKGSSPGHFFDFGRGAGSNFFSAPCGADVARGWQSGITRTGLAGVQGPVAPAIPTNRWVHLAVVLDAANKTMTCYLDGVRAGQAPGVTLALEQVLNAEDAGASAAFIGRSQLDKEPRLPALVHDVRIYSVALTEPQVTAIHKHAWSGGGAQAVLAGPAREAMETGSGIAQPMASRLVGVKAVAVKTPIGHLPHLPYLVPGIYPPGVAGPEVRVIWPSPTNNRQVLTSGTYQVVGRVPGTPFEAAATVTVEPGEAVPVLPQRLLETFPLGRVTLNRDEQQRDTPFIKNRDKFLKALADSNPDRFLYMFRNAFGQPQPEGARPLEGWDDQTTRLRGHATGHYLSAVAQAYASTAYDPELNARFQKKMEYLIDTLYDLSRKSGVAATEGGPANADPAAVPPGPGRAGYDSDLSAQGIRTDYWNWGRGFLSAYPPDQFIMLEQGALYGGKNNQVWAPYYTLHKILAGLLDCYEVGGNKKALAIAEGMARWVHQRLRAVPAATRISMWNRYIAGEYGGMNEVLARLSRLTGDTNFMACACLFDNVDFFFGDARHAHGLARNVDTLRGKHANQHIPQIIGALETFRGTRARDYWLVAENFWEICTHSYLYSIGGVAGARNPNNAECFIAQPDTLFANGFARGGQNETCATYNLLKLSRQLFLYRQEAKYMDYYEQALYNHILSSVAEHDAGNTYHVPLNPAARKQFGNARLNGFTCCNGTALESNTKLQDSIYFRSADHQALYVNLFIPSTLNWAERGVRLTQRTLLPYGDATRLLLAGGGAFDLQVRVPRWATRGLQVAINGRPQEIKAAPGTYVSLGRKWQDGDAIDLVMPMGFRLWPVMDQPNLASLFYGPVLLAAEESEPRSAWRPVTLNGEDSGKSLLGDPAALRFKLGETSFKPFYESYGRHSVYLNVTLE